MPLSINEYVLMTYVVYILLICSIFLKVFLNDVEMDKMIRGCQVVLEET